MSYTDATVQDYRLNKQHLLDLLANDPLAQTYRDIGRNIILREGEAPVAVGNLSTFITNAMGGSRELGTQAQREIRDQMERIVNFSEQLTSARMAQIRPLVMDQINHTVTDLNAINDVLRTAINNPTIQTNAQGLTGLQLGTARAGNVGGTVVDLAAQLGPNGVALGQNGANAEIRTISFGGRTYDFTNKNQQQLRTTVEDFSRAIGEFQANRHAKADEMINGLKKEMKEAYDFLSTKAGEVEAKSGAKALNVPRAAKVFGESAGASVASTATQSASHSHTPPTPPSHTGYIAGGAVLGAALGYMMADDENKARNTVIGGVGGGIIGRVVSGLRPGAENAVGALNHISQHPALAAAEIGRTIR